MVNLGLNIILHLKQKIISLLFFSFSISCYQPHIDNNSNDTNVDFLIKKGNLFWEQRTNDNSLKKADHFISLAKSKRPLDFELSILLSKIKFNIAKNIEMDPKLKDSLYLVGAKISKEAVLNHDMIKLLLDNSTLDSSSKILTSIAKAPKEVVPGLFWWAENLSHYLVEQPVIKRLNQRELLEVLMNRVIALDPGYYYSGPYRFFGALYTKIPGVELSQADTYFKQSIESNPEYFFNWISYAEFYHQKKGNREQYNKILKEVLNSDINQSPEIMNDNYFSKIYARRLLEEESLLFE